VICTSDRGRHKVGRHGKCSAIVCSRGDVVGVLWYSSFFGHHTVFVDFNHPRKGCVQDQVVFGVDSAGKSEMEFGAARFGHPPVAKVTFNGWVRVEYQDEFSFGEVFQIDSQVLLSAVFTESIDSIMETALIVLQVLESVRFCWDDHVVDVERGRRDVVVNKVEWVESVVSCVGILFDHHYQEPAWNFSSIDVRYPSLQDSLS